MEYLYEKRDLPINPPVRSRWVVLWSQFMKRKIVISARPTIGGIFRFYRNLRNTLAPLGWDIYAVSIGKSEASTWEEGFNYSGCIKISPEEEDNLSAAKCFVKWCIKNNISIVMPMNSGICNAAVLHMPSDISIIQRCYSTSLYSYDVVLSCWQRISRIIATSKRQKDDLICNYSISAKKIAFIPMGVDIDAFHSPSVHRKKYKDVLTIGYIGRLSDYDKGIFLLPRLVQSLMKHLVSFELQIIGNGPQELKLRKALKDEQDKGFVNFIGGKPHKEIPKLLGKIDILVMPSNFEGFGLSLIEAMAAGVVPIVSRIRGVTDWIVNDGYTGYVCPIGSNMSFTKAIIDLYQNPKKLSQMSRFATKTAKDRFNLEKMGESYDTLFSKVLLEKDIGTICKSWDNFEIPIAFLPNWHRFIPSSAKKIFRRWMEKGGRTI